MHHTPSIQHSLFLFEELLATMPPLVPKKITTDMTTALEQLKLNYHVSPAACEETLIAFGKKVWPYRKAFFEFYSLYEGKLGESFLRGHLTPTMKKRYEEFLVYGGTFRDLHTGRPAVFFSVEERTGLCTAFIAVEKEVMAHTIQAVMSTERAAYEAKIDEFTHILDDIEARLNTLRQMADEEQEHPELAAEIRGQVLAFEEGLCLLGQHTRYEAVCQAGEHFVGRKKEKVVRQRVHVR